MLRYMCRKLSNMRLMRVPRVRPIMKGVPVSMDMYMCGYVHVAVIVVFLGRVFQAVCPVVDITMPTPALWPFAWRPGPRNGHLALMQDFASAPQQ